MLCLRMSECVNEYVPECVCVCICVPLSVYMCVRVYDESDCACVCARACERVHSGTPAPLCTAVPGPIWSALMGTL